MKFIIKKREHKKKSWRAGSLSDSILASRQESIHIILEFNYNEKISAENFVKEVCNLPIFISERELTLELCIVFLNPDEDTVRVYLTLTNVPCGAIFDKFAAFTFTKEYIEFTTDGEGNPLEIKEFKIPNTVQRLGKEDFLFDLYTKVRENYTIRGLPLGEVDLLLLEKASCPLTAEFLIQIFLSNDESSSVFFTVFKTLKKRWAIVFDTYYLSASINYSILAKDKRARVSLLLPNVLNLRKDAPSFMFTFNQHLVRILEGTPSAYNEVIDEELCNDELAFSKAAQKMRFEKLLVRVFSLRKDWFETDGSKPFYKKSLTAFACYKLLDNFVSVTQLLEGYANFAPISMEILPQVLDYYRNNTGGVLFVKNPNPLPLDRDIDLLS